MIEFVVTLGKKKKEVRLLKDSAISVDGIEYNYELSSIGESTYLLKVNNKFYEITSQKINKEQYSVLIEGNYYEPIVRTALQEKAEKLLEQQKSVKHNLQVKAPMPGMILKVKKNIGDEIHPGEPVIILEAMKMENELRAPVKGMLKEIFVKEGSPVEKGAVLFIIE